MNEVLRGLLPSFARHLAAVLVGWLAARGWLETDPGSMTQTQEQFAETLLNLFSAVLLAYAFFEKALKPLFFRKLKELLPGEVGPVTHDHELAKAEKDAGKRK